MLKTFSKRVREKIYAKYNYQCANFKHVKCLGTLGLSIHHIVHNTKDNISKYGNDHIQSEENGILLCSWCHEHFGMFNDLRDELIQKWGEEIEYLIPVYHYEDEDEDADSWILIEEDPIKVKARSLKEAIELVQSWGYEIDYISLFHRLKDNLDLPLKGDYDFNNERVIKRIINGKWRWCLKFK